MSSRNDIFGNLDDFLENYDDNYLEASKLSEAEIDLDNSVREDHQPGGTNKSSGTVAKKHQPALVKSNHVDDPVQISTESSVCEAPVGSTTTAVALPSPPSTQPIVLDLTSNFSLQDAMKDLSRMYSYVYYPKDPIVTMHVKTNPQYYPTKRSFTTLHQKLLQHPPVTSVEMAKLKKRIEKVQMKLEQLYFTVEDFIKTKNSTLRSTQAARRRSRRLINSTLAPSTVITLDDDEPYGVQQSTSQAGRQNGLFNLHTQPNIISLDSDDENLSLEKLPSADNSFESENYEMRIKIKWGNHIETFTHRKHQKFSDLISKLAVKEEADTRCILLNLDDRIIYADDTPDSIGYKTFQFISGRVLRDQAPILQKAVTVANNSMISLKVQLANRKSPLNLQIDKNHAMIVLVIKCAEELKCKPEDIKLYFDGELVDNGAKPGDLELEGDELLDIRLVR